MKNRFCSIYLYLFLFDGFLGLFRGFSTLIGLQISFNLTFKIFAGIFSFAIFICAIFQSVLAFWKKWKLTARIIGIYVLFYTILSMIMGLLLGLIAAFEGMNPLETENFILRTGFMNLFAIIIGIIQVILFFWALKDLSKGHYLNKK